MDIKEVNIGYELPKETWEKAAHSLMKVAPVISKAFENTNKNGEGKKHAEQFMTDMQLACTALIYVANTATDKCRIIPISPNEAEN